MKTSNDRKKKEEINKLFKMFKSVSEAIKEWREMIGKSHYMK